MADSLSGLGGQRPSGPTTIPGRSRTIAQSDGHAPQAGQRERASSSPAPAEKQFVNLDGRSLNLAAPRGTYVNILV